MIVVKMLDSMKLTGLSKVHLNMLTFRLDNKTHLVFLQIINLLTHEELLKVLPKKLIRPRSFSVTSGKTLFLGGLARLDIIYGPESVRYKVNVFRTREMYSNN